MYKVFFVDDEAAMRAGLRDSISWNGSDFVLCGEAPDGEMAMPLISEMLPDILITDVKMPFMDGIELSRRVSRAMPWVKIIILSGHDEFEFAKEAIKIGVSEYLLKPVTSEILFGALQTAASQIESERERRRAIEGLKKEASDARRLQAEKILSGLVYGTAEGLPEDAGLALLGRARFFQTAVIEVASLPPDDGGALAMSISAASELIAANESAVSFQEGADRVVCVFAARSEDELDEETYSAAQAVKYETERRCPCLVSIAIGSSVRHISELPKSMSRAKKTLRHIAKTERPLILGYRDIGHDEHAGAAEGKEAVSAIGLKTSRYRDIIEKSREYIRLHYAEGSISLNSVAEFVGLSPNHFSTVFSQETGETFIEYLTRTRLAKAGEMLKSTRAKSSEIAYSVGYSDPHYFSYVFKKNIGVSPSEFRK